MTRQHQPPALGVRSEILTTRSLTVTKRSRESYRRAPVLIAIAHRNQPELLRRAVLSAVTQTLVVAKRAQVTVLDDQSEGDWYAKVGRILEHPAITVLTAECGSPSRARNQLLDWADSQAAIQWVARLDADDELANADSVEALFLAAKSSRSVASIGSNSLRKHGVILPNINEANKEELLDVVRLSGFIDSFCSGASQRELPSCNLLIKTRLGIRYPNIRSAEDHWLLCKLLIQHSTRVSVVSQPLYSIYSLDGPDTVRNKRTDIWGDQRRRLAYVVNRLKCLATEGEELLGYGLEGIVWCRDEEVIKEFYPWAIDKQIVSRLEALLVEQVPIPSVTWEQHGSTWRYSTKKLAAEPVEKYLYEAQVYRFLRELYMAGICALNVKKDNLIVNSNGKIFYIDVGKDLQKLTASYFLDMSARLYSVGVVGNDDEELVRRESSKKPDKALEAIPGLSQFYGNLIASIHPEHLLTATAPAPTDKRSDVTLLIKACAQDAEGFREQVAHIVRQLAFPVEFAKIVLVIDCHQGPFLRQYASPDIESVIAQAKMLQASGTIDEYMIAPSDAATVSSEYRRWFGNGSISHTHTANQAPLHAQIWAFSQIKTRYVLQCDCDVLVGRRDWNHDYIADMLNAIAQEEVLCVGFNIAQPMGRYTSYFGAPGQFAPEVRFGLLDLHRIYNVLPIENPVEEGIFRLTWHRALQQFQKESGFYVSLRGGNSSTFYLHPCNNQKRALGSGVIRDLIAQGLLPERQQGCFDLQVNEEWHYPARNEPIIFLLKGRRTPIAKLARCLKSLLSQSNQDFGVILIDDDSTADHAWCYPLLLQPFASRYTLIRHNTRNGRIPNFKLAVENICTNDDSLIVILDQDDFLMRTSVVEDLSSAIDVGHDLVQMPMFRPQKPLKLYQPDFERSRQKGGGNTWAHLRAFRKSLFVEIPDCYLQRTDGLWLDMVTDYATMLPMVELAGSPVFIDNGYAYWHERDEYSDAVKDRQRQLIRDVLVKPNATVFAVQRQGAAERDP